MHSWRWRGLLGRTKKRMTAIILTTGAIRKGRAEISEEVGENDSMTRGSRLLGEVFEVF